MDTAKGYIGAPAKADIPKLCAKCHSDVVRMRPFRLPTSQFQQYQQSVHGKKLAQGDQNVATCVDCHGAHATLSKNDPNSAVYISNVPKTCGKCHADKTRMAQYKIPTTQLADYTKSVHGLALLQKGDRAAPNCASCHSAHGATPPGRTEVADVCGSCHPEQEKYLKQGPHWQAIADSGGPKCIDCHGNHGISPPTDAMLVDSGEHGCGNCHSEGDKGETVGKQIHNMLTVAKLEMDAAAAQTSLAEAEGMDVADIQADVPAINTTLLEARVILHGLSVNDISGKIQPAREQIAKSLRSAKAMQAASLDRRKTLGLAGVAVLLLAGALFWRWSLIRITWRAGQSGEVPG